MTHLVDQWTFDRRTMTAKHATGGSMRFVRRAETGKAVLEKTKHPPAPHDLFLELDFRRVLRLVRRCLRSEQVD